MYCYCSSAGEFAVQPVDAHCCHMGTSIKHPVPDRLKPSFVIFDIRALWRSALTAGQREEGRRWKRRKDGDRRDGREGEGLLVSCQLWYYPCVHSFITVHFIFIAFYISNWCTEALDSRVGMMSMDLNGLSIYNLWFSACRISVCAACELSNKLQIYEHKTALNEIRHRWR